jgi:histone H3/H4
MYIQDMHVKTVQANHVLDVLKTLNRPITQDINYVIKTCKRGGEYKSNAECFLIPKLPFARLIRKIALETNNGVKLRFSQSALDLIQLDTQNYSVQLLNSANKLAIHGHRIRVMPKDLQIMTKICDQNQTF